MLFHFVWISCEVFKDKKLYIFSLIRLFKKLINCIWDFIVNFDAGFTLFESGPYRVDVSSLDFNKDNSISAEGKVHFLESGETKSATGYFYDGYFEISVGSGKILNQF